jgi:hypothetical protein
MKLALLSHGRCPDCRCQNGQSDQPAVSIEQKLSVYLPWICWSGSNENPKTQGQGSNGYLSPKSNPDGGEAAFD